MINSKKIPGKVAIVTGLLTFGFLVLVGCGGAEGLASPQVYGERPSERADDKSSVQNDSSKTSDALENRKPTTPPRKTIPPMPANDSSLTLASKPDTAVLALSSKADINRAETPQPDSDQKVPTHNYLGRVDNADSAAAVDDDIWRLFDLAEEYHAMGVIANREASWEEAQYYFEKCLKILANLDVETDSELVPEAVKYNAILDNVVSDYRVALRSLGQLQETTAPAVLIERFGQLGEKLERDSILLITGEDIPVGYDLPIVMNDRVKSSIIYFQTVAKDAFNKYLRRSQRYDRLFKEVLAKHGLPLDFVYLSLVESGFNPDAYSWARAMGLWQFISSTGRLYGLKRNWWVDERKDPEKSTDAAARFLKDLYERFGHWELAMAAYNGGPGRVSRAIKRQKTIDFWKLKLKRQTMDYVPLIYAAAIISKDPERYGFHDIEFEPEVTWETVEIDRCLDLKVVAKEIGCSAVELKSLNPELLRYYTPPNTKNYPLKIPVGSQRKFLAAYDKMPSPKETSWVQHKIKRGESVSTIAARYGVSQYAILEANNLSRKSRIFAGKKLIVPVPLDRDYSASKRSNRNYEAEGSIYSVRSGDTMWDIARAFGTSVDALRRINYIERGSRIYVGQKLRIPSDATRLKTQSHSPRVYASKPDRSESSQGLSSTKSDSQSRKKYTVRAGDTLWDIARAMGTTTGKLRKLNGLGRSSRIYPGQVLSVTGDGGPDYIIHKVKRGESLSRIARKYRTTIAKIMAANDMIDPDNIKIGARLRIYVR